MFSREELAGGFRALGVREGDVVMLHASVRAVGDVAGGPDQIHLALTDALGATGTLMMYASCPAYYDEVGRGNLTPAEEREVVEKLPPFDAATAPSQRENGALVEFFRRYPGTRVNDHVARFAVRGAKADVLLSEQPWDFAFGRGSALERFTALDGRILLLGCDHDNVTFLHYAEHIVDVLGKRVAAFKVPVLVNGTRVWRDMKEYDTAQAAHPSWPGRFFGSIVDEHLAATCNPGGRVGHAQAYLVESAALLHHALTRMKEEAGRR